ncbi:Protein male abnormal 7 [Toxocara canis]|uniref:Protein male abnormal 7 n=1 Tax=Toxocara canis TaxID=6265 RepID=A0A0B2W0T9_TOXCA|nr:Protein male abnormal 7 [Toxocara canis]
MESSICILIVLMCTLVVTTAQVASKSIVHFCDPNRSGSCGYQGVCMKRRTGNRCKCPRGYMGVQCKRPCQDVYLSCKRWKEEDRCNWARPILPFFEDNCALTCGRCQSLGRKLALALPPILEPISWMIGKWQTETTSSEHFPVSMSGPYHEVFDVSISEVPMFDRPPVNISVTATTRTGDVSREVGFMTGKPFLEDTGFIEFNKPTNGSDQVAIEMVSNTGLITIEEGILQNNEIRLELKYIKSIFGPSHPTNIKMAKRSFQLLNSNTLLERAIVEDSWGRVRKWSKRYVKTVDYLSIF